MKDTRILRDMKTRLIPTISRCRRYNIKAVRVSSCESAEQRTTTPSAYKKKTRKEKRKKYAANAPRPDAVLSPEAASCAAVVALYSCTIVQSCTVSNIGLGLGHVWHRFNRHFNRHFNRPISIARFGGRGGGGVSYWFLCSGHEEGS